MTEEKKDEKNYGEMFYDPKKPPTSELSETCPNPFCRSAKIFGTMEGDVNFFNCKSCGTRHPIRWWDQLNKWHRVIDKITKKFEERKKQK